MGISIHFQRVTDPRLADIRIGFQAGAGSWSYVGRDILNISNPEERTMNLCWTELSTAVHEIGHTLGFSHEHQNPKAGIVWDEEAVYAALADPPNNWSREKTHYNIIRQLDPRSVHGSDWDKDSIMHYPFNAGLIKEPEKYQTHDLIPAPGLSERDKHWARTFYPAETEKIALTPFRPHPFGINAGEQISFSITPERGRTYNIGTFGAPDTVMVL